MVRRISFNGLEDTTFFKALPVRLVRAGLNFVLPPRCPVSFLPVDRLGAVAPEVWKELRFIAAPQCATCGLPFEFTVTESGDASECANCLRRPPPYAKARAALAYDDTSRNLILRFKHGDRLDVALTLAGWMARAGGALLQESDVIVPVPLHRWRLLRRRYNQAAILAWQLSRVAGKSCIPDALLRRRHTPMQKDKNAKERHRNVRGAFAVHPKRLRNLEGRTVVLVDDVYTSGATLRECTKTLLRAGAAKVHVLTAARVIRPES